MLTRTVRYRRIWGWGYLTYHGVDMRLRAQPYSRPHGIRLRRHHHPHQHRRALVQKEGPEPAVMAAHALIERGDGAHRL